MDKVVIVMPAWNEVENIERMISTLLNTEFPKIKADMRLLVVDNKSTDGMTELVEKLSKSNTKVEIIQQGDKKGLGNAYITGFKYAINKLKADAVMEMDADGQHPPEFVKPMVDAYLNGGEYVIGSRYIPGGSVPKEWAMSRRAISFFGNLFIRLVLLKPKLHDLTTGFRLMKVKGVLGQINLDNLMEPERFAYKVDLLYQCVKNSKKTVEVPLQFRPRTTDKSKFNSKEMISTFKVAIILGIKDKAKFMKFATVGFIGYLVNAITLEIFSRMQFTSNVASNFPESFPLLSEPSAWAAAFAAEAAIINNFTLNNLWTFKSEKISGIGKTFKKFLQFNLSSVGAIIIQFIVIGLMVTFFGDTALIRQLGVLVSLPLVLSYNYTMYNLFIWKSWKKKK